MKYIIIYSALGILNAATLIPFTTIAHILLPDWVAFALTISYFFQFFVICYFLYQSLLQHESRP